MVRTVRVDLEADVARYTGPVEDAKVKTEELDRKVEGLDRDLNKVPVDAAKAAASLRLLGDETGKAGLKLDDLGKKSTSLGMIDDRIAQTRTEVRNLADEFNRTGNAGVLGKLFGAQSDLKDLEKLKTDISGVLEQGAADGGREGAKSFASAMEGGLATPGLGPVLVGALVTAAVVAAPAIGPALIGGAGIAAGIIGQIHDPEVHKALTDLGHDMKTTLAESTSDFKQPLIAAAAEVDSAFKAMLGQVDWKSAAADLTPFIHGLAELGVDIMPGLNKLLTASAPFFQSLGKDLPMLGQAISTAFDMMSRGGRGAQETIRLVIATLSALIIIVGAVVLGLSKAEEWTVAWDQRLGAFLIGLGNVFPPLRLLGTYLLEIGTFLNGANDGATGLGKAIGAAASAASTASPTFDDLNKQLNQTAQTMDTLAGSMVKKVFDGLMSIDQATLSVAESLTKLDESFDKNGRSIKIHTKEGQANREAILAAVTANMQLYQAQIASGMSADDAAHNYDINTAALNKQLRQAGLTQAQIDGLIGKYKAVPDTINTTLAIEGLTQAIRDLDDLLRRLNGLPPRTDVSVNIHQRVINEGEPHPTLGGVHAFAAGGVVEHAASGLLRDAGLFAPAGPARYAFAEPSTGGEAFVPRLGDYGRSTAILDHAARWYGGRFAPAGAGQTYAPTYHVYVSALDARAAGPVVIEAIKSYERSNGTNWRSGPL